MGLLAWLKQLDRSRRHRRYAGQMDAFNRAAAALLPGDIAIDCGANIGKFTRILAAGGARVYAFEPNPTAFAELQKNTADLPNVTLFNAATTTAPGTVRLYLHKRAKQDPLLHSVSSSLLSAKSNINPDDFCDVDSVVLSDFIEELGAPVKLLKMDVEGAEVELLNQLLDRGLHKQIVQGFVEVHDRRVKALAEPTRALRQRLLQLRAEHITLDWR
jgi:FkbM family methyltransferase